MELSPFSYGFHEDPYPTRWLRDNAPVYRNDELNFYALSHYQDVLAASVDHEPKAPCSKWIRRWPRRSRSSFS